MPQKVVRRREKPFSLFITHLMRILLLVQRPVSAAMFTCLKPLPEFVTTQPVITIPFSSKDIDFSSVSVICGAGWLVGFETDFPHTAAELDR